MRRLERSRLSLVAWALLGFGAIAIGLLLIVVGPRSLSSTTFELRAVFRSEAELTIRSPVRIAGVDVGKVTGIEPVGKGSDAAVVVMQIEDAGLPIHADAAASIRPRLFLEGNFFVELDPGTPDAAQLRSGGAIGADRTAGPVQLDRVLGTLTTDTRANLRTLVQGLGRSLGDLDGSETAGQSLNDSVAHAPQALQGLIETNSGLRGESPDDLSELVGGTQKVMTELADRQRSLADLISGFEVTTAAFASRQAELRSALRLLPPVLADADAAFASLDRALPRTRDFALELGPSLGELPATIDSALPWIGQARPLLSADELGGLAGDLAPAVRDTATAVDASSELLRGLDRLSSCALHNLLPTADGRIEDPPLPAGATVQQEFFQTIVGLVGSTQNFDANGRYARAQTAGGAYPVQSGPIPGAGPMRGNAVRPPIGTRPAYPGAAPPLRFDVRCAGSAPPDLNSAATGAGP